MSEHLLDVRDLCISFVGRDGNALEAVNKLNLHIDAGEIVGVVGESGCGKSVFAQSVMRLLEHEQKMAYTGQILFDGEDLLARPLKRMREVRGCDIAMIFQDPLSSLNPVMTVGAQVVEAVRAHRKVSDAKPATRPYRCWSVWEFEMPRLASTCIRAILAAACVSA